MTKQEKIKDSYGEYWDRVKDFVDKNGWTEYPKLGSSKLLIDFGGEYGAMPDQFFCRPSSLKGIEDNNGWIRIDSKRDLPSKNGHYFVLRSKIVEVMEYFDNGKTRGFIRSGSDYINKYNEIGITHYQPIQNPEPPLF